MRAVLVFVIGSFLSGLVFTRDAVADGSKNLQAEALFVEGRRLMKAQKYVEACAKFESSQALDPAVGTLMNLADCNVRINRTASAWAQFREAAAMADRSGDRRRGGAAAQRAAALEPKLARLRVVTDALPSSGPFIIRINERELPAAAWNTGMPVDPGTQVIVVTSTGYTTWRTQAEATVAGETVVVISAPLKVAADALPGVERAVPQAASPVPRDAARAPQAEASYTGMWIAAGVTGAALVAGGVFGYLASDRWQGVTTDCRERGACTPGERTVAKEARSAGTTSTIAFASAGVAAIVTGILWRRASTNADEAAQVSCWFDHGSAGASLTGRF